jgi:hypothetical protein
MLCALNLYAFTLRGLPSSVISILCPSHTLLTLTPCCECQVLDIMPGVSGGVARVLIGQPFDTIKTRLQVSCAVHSLAEQHCRKLPAWRVVAR